MSSGSARTIPTFAGIFPVAPLLPGVFQLEMARVAAESVLNCPLAVREIRKAKFRRPILPAETRASGIEIVRKRRHDSARARHFPSAAKPAGETALILWRSELRKWLKRICSAAVLLVLGGWSAGTVAVAQWTAKPPPLPADTSIMRFKPEAARRQGLAGQIVGRPARRLARRASERLAASKWVTPHGVLMQDQMHTLENEFLEMIHGYVPQHWVMEVLKNYVIYRNRHLSEYVPLKYRLEIYGTTLGCPDIHPEEGSFYNRLLNYHAAHDVSYMMIDNPLVSRAGCTAFGAWGGATENGHLDHRTQFRLGSRRSFQPRPRRDDVRTGRWDSVHLAVVGRHGRSRFRHEPRGHLGDGQRRAVQPAERNRDAGGDGRAGSSGNRRTISTRRWASCAARRCLSPRSGWWAAARTESSSSWKKLPRPRKCASRRATRSSAPIISKRRASSDDARNKKLRRGSHVGLAAARG